MKWIYDPLNDYYIFVSFDQVRDAYIRLSKMYHPDVSKEIDHVEKFKEISEAYRKL